MNLLEPPIEFPPIPLIAEIPGGVRVGLLIRIQGKISKRSHRFSINIATGEQISPPMSDIGFHFNPRFDAQYVARNSLIDDIWGDEEFEAPSDMPFTRGSPFEVLILVENLHYKVAVDGVHFLHFNHRIPIEALRWLQVLGDIKVYKLEFLESRPPEPAYGFQPQALGLTEPVEIFNPDIPYVAKIPGGVRVGLLIKIEGKVPKRAADFKINIAAGHRLSRPRSDIGFHLNPRFDCGYVARNALIDENWGNEENEYPSELPIDRRETFELSILVEPSFYKVSFNGAHFLNFNHRMPMEALTTLQILDDVKVFKLEFKNAKPANYEFQPLSQLGFGNSRDILNPIVPFRQVIPGGMYIGKTIMITGRPKPYATQFSINLEKTREIEPDNVFHLNPRFGGMGEEPSSVIVRNHYLNGEWGYEERETHSFPFLPGFNFDMTITCEEQFYLVAINGQHLLSFKHRLPFDQVDTLYVVGDVDIMSIRI